METTVPIPYEMELLNGKLQPTVDGRDIYRFLDIKKPFPHWIKTQIKRANLTENEDFRVYALQGINSGRGRPSNEYRFAFDPAKHICMASGAPKGREVRDYFIECEAELLREREAAHAQDQLPPAYQAIVDLVHRANEIEKIAERAETKADAAVSDVRQLREAYRMTLPDYAAMHDYDKKFGKRWYAECGKDLVTAHITRGYSVLREGVAWEVYSHMNRYLVDIMDTFVPRWLMQRYGEGLL